MEYLERAKALRGDKSTHYNCCQSTLMPFCGKLGLEEEEGRKAGAFFGSGMRCGGVCGAVTGALMVLGLAGADDTAGPELMKRFQDKNGFLNCAQLLKAAAERGEERKAHCDRMVYDAVEMTKELLEE